MPAAGACRLPLAKRLVHRRAKTNNANLAKCVARRQQSGRHAIRPCPGHATPVAPMKNGARPRNLFQQAPAKSSGITMRSSTRTPEQDGCPWSAHTRHQGGELAGRVLHPFPSSRKNDPTTHKREEALQRYLPVLPPRRAGTSSRTHRVGDRHLWAGLTQPVPDPLRDRRGEVPHRALHVGFCAA